MKSNVICSYTVELFSSILKYIHENYECEIFQLLCLLCASLLQDWVKWTLHTSPVRTHTHTHIDTHIPAPNERQKGVAGLTDQFPISPGRPAVIRSSYTWREAWIPLGFISSNYLLLPPHAVLLLTIRYFSSGSWHCPFLPPSSSLFPHLDGSFICCVSVCIFLATVEMLVKVTLTRQ